MYFVSQIQCNPKGYPTAKKKKIILIGEPRTSCTLALKLFGEELVVMMWEFSLVTPTTDGQFRSV